MTGVATPQLLDGRAFAARRAPEQSRRAEQLRAERGRAPLVWLVGFGVEDDVVPTFIARKLRACEAVGVHAVPRILGPRATTDAVIAAIDAAPAGADALFVEFPYPDGVDGDAVAAAIPARLDVDVMSPARVEAYRAGVGEPPVTVLAALGLLDDGGIDVAGMEGVVVADPSPFSEMFATALARRGARMTRVAPADAGRARAAQLVVAAAARPGIVRADELAAGAVVIDVGYFNPGGRGDVDTRGGTSHLRALAPVPGGIGPSTIAMLVERVIDFAEGKG